MVDSNEIKTYCNNGLCENTDFNVCVSCFLNQLEFGFDSFYCDSIEVVSSIVKSRCLIDDFVWFLEDNGKFYERCEFGSVGTEKHLREYVENRSVLYEKYNWDSKYSYELIHYKDLDYTSLYNLIPKLNDELIDLFKEEFLN